MIYTLSNKIIYLLDENCKLNEQSSWSTYIQKIEDTNSLFTDVGIHLLDGDIITVDGVTIAGAMGWYDVLYPKLHNIIGLGGTLSD